MKFSIILRNVMRCVIIVCSIVIAYAQYKGMNTGKFADVSNPGGNSVVLLNTQTGQYTSINESNYPHKVVKQIINVDGRSFTEILPVPDSYIDPKDKTK